MTIASTTSKVSYNGSGSTGPFPITFKFTKNADIVATKRSSAGVETVLTLTTHYTLTGAGDASGGTLNLVTALAVGESLVIARSPGIVQEVDYVENSAFPAETHEGALDLLTMICQSLQEQIDRSVKVEISSTTIPDDLLSEIAIDVAGAAAAAATATTQAGLANTARTAAELAETNAEASAASISSVVSNGVLDIESSGGFWADDTTPGKTHRIEDRLFVGDASFSGNWDGADNPFAYLRWTLRESTQIVFSPVGRLGLSGLARTSDQTATTGQPNGAVAIGVIGVGVADRTANDLSAANAWGGYFESFRTASVTNAAFGVEIDVGNDGADVKNSPYSLYGSYATGLNIAAGGSYRYPTTLNSPSTAAIVIGKNTQTFNKGIVFGKDALTGADGSTGVASAIVMARGHVIEWQSDNGAASAQLFSNGLAANRVSQNFGNNFVRFYGAEYNALFSIEHVASSVNYVRVYPQVTGSAPAIQAQGTDTNVDLLIAPKGTGNVRFGTWTSNADAAVNGYITIKDAAGNSRKLATIA